MESENIPPPEHWPPLRLRTPKKRPRDNSSERRQPESPSKPFPPLPVLSQASSDAAKSPDSPLEDRVNKRPRYQNGYQQVAKVASYMPYQRRSTPRKTPSTRADEETIEKVVGAHPGLHRQEWGELAKKSRILPSTSELREYQMQCTNAVLMRAHDICVIAPTGSGKSLLWCLPLLVHSYAISLVVTPYTSLGHEGEEKMNALGFRAIFINSEKKCAQILHDVSRGHYNIVFVCPEMLECPTFADVLHTPQFAALLCAIFLDEAHLIFESAHWRIPYSRLKLLRPVIGYSVPIVAMSATLPALYRKALILHAGLKPNHLIVNLGNHRPELATAIVPMKHDVSSFQDLAFVLPSFATLTSVPKTIIYCDDLDLLTEMFWWLYKRLVSMRLPSFLVDILHAGLSDDHEDRVIADFRTGKTRILLGSEKIGAGMNFPSVLRVVQYLCRDPLTLPKLRQREGRGARTPGTTSVGYLMVEPSVLKGIEDPSKMPSSIHSDVLALIRASGCLDDIFDLVLENPPRPSSAISPGPPRLCCSNCHPSLLPAQEFRFTMVDPTQCESGQPAVMAGSLTTEERGDVLEKLKQWRDHTWRTQWRTFWPDFGPRSLISDSDLESVTKHASSISALDDLHPVTHISFWDELAEPLLKALQKAVGEVTGAKGIDEGGATRQVAVHDAMSRRVPDEEAAPGIASGQPAVEDVSGPEQSSRGPVVTQEAATVSHQSLQPLTAIATAPSQSSKKSRKPREPRIGPLYEHEAVVTFN